MSCCTRHNMSEESEKELKKLDREEMKEEDISLNSKKAMNKMKDMGFKEVYNLSGGFPTWASAGYEVSK